MTTSAKLIEIFQDTLNMMEENPSLMKVLAKSAQGTHLYKAEDPIEAPDRSVTADRNCEITVTPYRTFEAAQKLCKKYPGKRVGVLNFASATNPGGGVIHGAFAQEECLCRCSTLFPVLDADALWDPYYRFHRDQDGTLYTDACIYTPAVKVIKTDVEEPERMPEKDWYDVDVITCAAPNLRFDPDAVNAKGLLELHLSRGQRILQVAAANWVDVLVLGAFGCGAFRNNPKIVADAYRQLMDLYRNYFTAIEFAVYCRDDEKVNYNIFKQVLL